MSWTLKTVGSVIENLQHFELDQEKIKEVARIMKPTVKAIDRSWDWEPHKVDKPEDKWPMLAVQNILNYMGWKIYNGEKRTFTIEHEGKRYHGAEAIMACIKRAYDGGIKILNPTYLKRMKITDAKRMFDGQREVKSEDGTSKYVDMMIPAFLDRFNYLKNLGKRAEEFGGFEGMVEKSGGYAFREDESGLVQLLARADGYNDVATHEPTKSLLKFYKKAQLAVIMGFESRAIPEIKDKENLSDAADYMLPAFGLYTGMIKVRDSELLKKLQDSEVIKSGSVQELEMRSCTVAIGSGLADAIGEVTLKAKDGSQTRAKCIEYMVDLPMFKQARNGCRKIGTKESICATECAYKGICNAMSDPEVAKFGLPRVIGSFY